MKKMIQCLFYLVINAIKKIFLMPYMYYVFY
jgi:hypothetical protein